MKMNKPCPPVTCSTCVFLWCSKVLIPVYFSLESVRQPPGFWHVLSKDYWSNLQCRYSSFSCSLSYLMASPKFDKFLFKLSVFSLKILKRHIIMGIDRIRKCPEIGYRSRVRHKGAITLHCKSNVKIIAACIHLHFTQVIPFEDIKTH